MSKKNCSQYYYPPFSVSSFRLRLVQKRLQFSCPAETAGGKKALRNCSPVFFGCCSFSLLSELSSEKSIMPLDWDIVMFKLYCVVFTVYVVDVSKQLFYEHHKLLNIIINMWLFWYLKTYQIKVWQYITTVKHDLTTITLGEGQIKSRKNNITGKQLHIRVLILLDNHII